MKYHIKCCGVVMQSRPPEGLKCSHGIAIIEEVPDNFKITQQSQGLGDTISKMTAKLGIKQCGGCKSRQDKLNNLFPYKKNDNNQKGV